MSGAKSIDDIQPYMMLHPTRNVLLEKNGRRKRGGTAHAYAAAYTGAPRLMGLFNARYANGNSFILAATKAGDLYKDDTTTIKTGLSTDNFFSFAYASGEDKTFIVDGASTMQIWDGAAASTSDVHEPAADWAAAPPIQVLLHGKGVSQRIWALNRNAVYASKTYAAALDLEHFATSAEAIYVQTEDGSGLVGMVEFGDRIFVFGKTNGYLIDDTDTTSSNWGYDALQWTGGVAHWRLIIKTPNDLVLMSEDGEVYSATAVETYGDYKRASLTKGSWMHDWIKEFVDLTYIDYFHGLYDPEIRAIVIWVVRKGMTTIDTALVYFLDRQSPEEGWMVFDNQNYASGYDASCSAIIRVAAGNWKCYTGDFSGEVWKLNQANRNDNGNPISAGFKSVSDSFGAAEITKAYNRLHVNIIPKGDWNIGVKVSIDGVYKATKYISMAGGGALLDAFVLGTDTLGGDESIEKSCKLGRRGKRIQYEFFNNGDDEDFFISTYSTEFKPVGIKQA